MLRGELGLLALWFFCDSLEFFERGEFGVLTDMEMWTEVLGSERLTGEALDRLTHRCHITEAKKGGSYQLKDARRRPRERSKEAVSAS